MEKRWVAVLAGFVLIYMIPLSLILGSMLKSNGVPKASDGRMDLTGWDFEGKGSVELSGDWEFYRGQLLTPDDFKGSSSKSLQQLTGYVQVPGKWNRDMEGKATGHATYRLIVELDSAEDVQKLYALHTNSIRLAHRIFFNGEEIGSSGRPGTSAGSTISGNVPYVAVGSAAKEAEIIVQIANYSYSSGGMIYPILFGDVPSVMKNRDRAMWMDHVAITGFAIPAFFFLLMYRLRKDERSLLHMGLFCTAALIYLLTHGQKLLAEWLPEMSYEMFMRIQLGSSAFAYYYLLRYTASSMQGSGYIRIIRAGKLASAAIIFMAVCLPTLWFSAMEGMILLYSLSMVGCVAYIMVRTFAGRREERLSLFLSLQSVLIVIAASLLEVFGASNQQMLIPYGMLIFVVTQAIMLARRFAATFQSAEHLSEKLLTLDGLKDQFMANTSHELRTPLHGMVNIAQSLTEGAAGSVNSEQEKQLKLIISTGKRLTSLINDILDFEKLKASQIQLNLAPVHLPSVVQSVVEVMEYVKGGKSITFVQEWPERLPLLHTDESRLRQMLYNLLGNAVKFTERGTIRIGAEVHRDEVVISVEDTGAGIPAHRLDSLFTAYDQAGDAMDWQYQGTGLGLYITRSLVELNGGRIWVETTEGSGSTFRFTIPSASGEATLSTDVRSGKESFDDPVVQAEQTALRMPASFGHHKVLVVDDDPVNRQILMNLLSVLSCEVTAVADGADALDALHSGPAFDLVMIDWMMPRMSGIELSRKIRARYSLYELPILMLTARSLQGDIQTAFSAGVNDYLTKPVDAEELRARTGTLIQLRKSVRDAFHAEIAFLQAQIKPHFLYNALNTIIATCPVSPDRAMELLVELSQYLRNSFDFHNREQLVPLAKELELVQAYLALEQARFEDRLQVVYELPDQCHALLPPLTIQPIVENAVRHGVMQKPQGGRVHIAVTDEPHELLVRVTDEGVGMPQAKADELLSEGRTSPGGVGMINIHKRLLSLYGAESGLKVASAPGQGTSVTFRIPKR
ncbi:response regulator [Paenibacillus nanensis]|uniref:histidine kinase n=1 Tax=Paenibacillus nanensis TaxID=393251 RepID=A0A3A1UNZ3_9BACL|nr:ATP-binding protein [Paenibacillus nanensis]RIX50064.1 response regulator [Paenibacillus nanensis]